MQESNGILILVFTGSLMMMRHAAVFLLVLCGLSWVSWARQGEVPKEPSKEPAKEPRVFREIAVGEGPKLRYALVTPPHWKEGQPAPTLVAFPPGAQNESMVEMGLSMYWEAEAVRRGWVVASPMSREGKVLMQDEPALLALLDDLAKLGPPEGGKVHLAGVSNGGKTAMRLATRHPARVASLLVLPGAPGAPEEWARLDKLKGMSVTMYVGEEDRVWLQECKRVQNELQQLGASVMLHVMEGQGHVLKIEPSTLFGDLEKSRPREASAAPTPSAFAGALSGPSRDDAVRQVSGVLDDFHDAASKADGPRYFAHFADDAVFLGTDATERWTLTEFKAFAKPYFEKGKGWTYTSRQRHINLTPDGHAAWFDELLDNAKLGECRGSGVLIRVGEGWKVAQYNLSIPIPNALAEQFAQTIAEKAGRSERK